jgi:hyperosmotically inducible protein
MVYITSKNEEGTEVSRLIKSVCAVALLGVVSACASAPPKTEAQKQADKVTAERVEAAFSADKTLYAKHITVHADNGVVWLTGYVWDRPDYDQATSVAESVPGVTRVVNDLEFNRNGSDASPISR